MYYLFLKIYPINNNFNNSVLRVNDKNNFKEKKVQGLFGLLVLASATPCSCFQCSSLCSSAWKQE